MTHLRDLLIGLIVDGKDQAGVGEDANNGGGNSTVEAGETILVETDRENIVIPLLSLQVEDGEEMLVLMTLAIVMASVTVAAAPFIYSSFVILPVGPVTGLTNRCTMTR